MIVLRLLWLLATVLLATRRSNPMPTDTSDTNTLLEPVELGDITRTADNPIIDIEPEQFDGIDVLVNIRLARTPNGHHAIRVICPENVTLTAAQAHQLHIDLEYAGRWVADIRRDNGHGS